MTVIYRDAMEADLNRWHFWRPWVPVKLTEVRGEKLYMYDSGPRRWIILVERRLAGVYTQRRIGGIWEFRDVAPGTAWS